MKLSFTVKTFAFLATSLLCGVVKAQQVSTEPLVNTNAGCMQDAALADGDNTEFGCTANDISVGEVKDINVATCIDGEEFTFTGTAVFELNAQARYDIGVWFSTDGDPNGDGSLTGQCTVTVPPNSGAGFLDLDGPPLGEAPDLCGDIDVNTSPMEIPISITTLCQAGTDGKLNLPYCTSWRVAGNNEICNDASKAYPGTPAKCKCDETFTIPITVVPNTESPSSTPSAAPSSGPTPAPSAAPSSSPSSAPSAAPSSNPTPSPSAAPSGSPSASPSETPTSAPSDSPSSGPTPAPSTAPSSSPSASPSDSPSSAPTPSPSAAPSESPSASPSETPSSAPSASPTPAPSAAPSSSPSASPSDSPSSVPSAAPSSSPTSSPSAAPSDSPSSSPSESPSSAPSASPSGSPSSSPSTSPSAMPSAAPSEAERLVYALKCASTVYLCGLSEVDIDPDENSTGGLGGCGLGRFTEVVVLDYPSCLDEPVQEVCPNGQDLSNFSTGYCQNALEEECFCCEKVEKLRTVTFPIELEWPDDLVGECAAEARKRSLLRK